LPTLDVIFANVGKQRLVAGASFWGAARIIETPG
jgi:hypothetical protein